MKVVKISGVTQADNPFFHQNQLSPQERFVLMVLIHHAFGTKDSCFPSQKRIAIICGLSTRQIRNILKELEKQNLVLIVRNNKRQTNTYIVSKKYTIYFDEQSYSYHMRTKIPLSHGNEYPTNKYKLNKTNKKGGLKTLKETLESIQSSNPDKYKQNL